MEPNEIKQRDRPGILALAAGAWEKWGAGALLCGGAVALTVGAALIYPPAGWITGGVRPSLAASWRPSEEVRASEHPARYS